MDNPLLDSHGTVFKYDLLEGGIDEIVDLVSAVHHRSGNKLQRPGSLTSKISSQDELATSGAGRHDQPHDAEACPGGKNIC